MTELTLELAVEFMR